MKRLLRSAVAVLMLGIPMFLSPTAASAASAATSVFAGYGTMYPGLGLTPFAWQSFGFSGTGITSGLVCGVPEANVSHDIAATGDDIIGTYAASEGKIQLYVSGNAGCSWGFHLNGTYVREGADLTVSLTGNGSAAAKCLFQPNQTPPERGVSFRLNCVLSIAATYNLVFPSAGTDPPSSQCQLQPVHQQVADNTTQGVHTTIYTATPSPSEVDVCFRAETYGLGLVSSDGHGYGGRIAITPKVPGVTDIPGVPTTDGGSSACSTTTPNAVPGAHPLSSGGIAGVPYAFDVYSDGSSTVWVCVQVGSSISDRVIVPVGVPSLGGLNEVTYYPDAPIS